MERLSRVLATANRILRSRLFAAGVLAVATLGMAVTVSVLSHAVTVIDGDDSRVVLTMHSDPYKAVEMAGVEMANYDLLRVDTKAGEIAVDRALTVEVSADGVSTLLYMMDGTTVQQALQQADVTLNPYDTLNCALTDPITDGMAVQVDRVAYEEYTVTETIAYSQDIRLTAVLKPGRTKVVQAGANGSKTITYRKTIVNGEVAETAKISETVTKQPTTRIVLQGSPYGTPLSAAPGGIQLDSKNQPVNYTKKYTGSCTAYSIGKRGASGLRLGVGTVAVNPSVIPYGTKLWITSADGKFVYGYAIAADTGAFAAGTKTFCDLYMGSYDECLYFGRRTLNIYVIG